MIANMTDFDVEAFALRVAALQREHDSRTDEEGAVRSAEAMRAWGVPVPRAILANIPTVKQEEQSHARHS